MRTCGGRWSAGNGEAADARGDAPARAGPFRAGKRAAARWRKAVGPGGWGVRGTARDGAGSGGAGALRNGEAEYGNKKEA